jgi:hypothetical protein
MSPVLKVYFYMADGPDEPLGGEEFWLTAAPRLGETVCVLYRPPGQAAGEQRFFGTVTDLQWTVQKRDDGNSELPDWVTLDAWLTPIAPNPAGRAAKAAGPVR